MSSALPKLLQNPITISLPAIKSQLEHHIIPLKNYLNRKPPIENEEHLFASPPPIDVITETGITENMTQSNFPLSLKMSPGKAK